MSHARIVAAGKYLPSSAVTNLDLVARHGFSMTPGWISEKTGIVERRYAAEHETTISMGQAAVADLLRKASLTDLAVDVLIGTSSTSELSVPAWPNAVAAHCGVRADLVFELNAACAAFTAAFDVANQYIRNGAERVLVVSSELASRSLVFSGPGDHFKLAPLLGDGAGAVLLERSDEVGVEGTGRMALAEHWRNVVKSHVATPEFRDLATGVFLYLNEGGISDAYVRAPAEAARLALSRAAVTTDDIRWLVTHQPSVNMLTQLREQLGIPAERHLVNVRHYGNTNSASVPIALDELIGRGLITRGDRILMIGMGAGFQAVAHVLRY